MRGAVRSAFGAAAPARRPPLAGNEQVVEQEADDRQRQDTRIHPVGFQHQRGMLDEVADAGLRGEHFGGNDREERGLHAEPRSRDDRGNGGGEDHLLEKVPIRRAHGTRGLDEQWIDRLHADNGVDQQEEDGGVKGDGDLRGFSDAENDDEDRQKRELRRVAQRLDEEVGGLLEERIAAHQETERHGGDAGEQETDRGTLQADADMVGKLPGDDHLPQYREHLAQRREEERVDPPGARRDLPQERKGDDGREPEGDCGKGAAERRRRLRQRALSAEDQGTAQRRVAVCNEAHRILPQLA